MALSTPRVLSGGQRLGAGVRALSSAAGGDILYTEEHLALRASVAKLIASDINPHVDQWEADGVFPAHEVFKKLGGAGFLGVTKPVEFGGMGLDYSFAVALAEEMGTIRCGGVPMAIGVQTDMATPSLGKFGSDDVRERFLRPTIAGDYVACLGVSEAGAGSDVAGVATTAVRDGDEYVINGSKMWTTNGTQADWMCLLANTSSAEDAGGPHHNKSLICMPMKVEGVTVEPRFTKLGMRSSDTTQVFLDNVRVPVANRIGDEGKGFQYQMIQFQEERLFAAANILMPLETCVAETLAYVSQRKAFGKPLAANQVVQFKLAQLETEIELLRALVYRTAMLYVRTGEVTRLATMCKLKAGQLAREVTDSCLQFWGGMGYIDSTFVTRMYRDLRLISIGGGADEVMLGILTKLQHAAAAARK